MSNIESADETLNGLLLRLSNLFTFLECLEQDPASDLTANAYKEMEEITAALVSKTDSFVGYMRHTQHELDMEKAAIEFRMKKVNRLDRRLEFLQNYAMSALQRAGMSSIEGEESKLSLRPATSVVIHDQNKLPVECLITKVVTTPDKALIKSYLKQGKIEPAAASIVINTSLQGWKLKENKDV